MCLLCCSDRIDYDNLLHDWNKEQIRIAVGNGLSLEKLVKAAQKAFKENSLSVQAKRSLRQKVVFAVEGKGNYYKSSMFRSFKRGMSRSSVINKTNNLLCSRELSTFHWKSPSPISVKNLQWSKRSDLRVRR